LQEIRLTADEYLAVAFESDLGCVRKNNEDSAGVFPGEDPARGSLLVVADGMGGAAAGEVASKTAVESVREAYFRPDSGSSPAEALTNAVVAANEAIYRKAIEHTNLAGMGTTCTAVAVVGREISFAHVGDSRAYLASGGELRQLTRDHSLAAEYERTGDGGAAAARAKNVLTRCLGVKPEVKVDGAEGAISLPDDGTLVLCSDGLTNQVEDGEILHMVAMHLPEGACRRLVQLARERGGPDNITVVVARMTRG
jgi:protein phosphatase